MTAATIAAGISYIVIVLAFIIITIATRRFLQGEFKDILKSLLIGFWFMLLPYGFLLLREVSPLTPTIDAGLSWAIYGLMIVVGLYILRAGILLYRFSNDFGFADKA